MSIRVTHSLDGLFADMSGIPRKAATGVAKAVRDNARAGNRLAQANASRTARKHGKYYPRTITAERISPFAWEYGPDADKVVVGKTGSLRPGRMSFEYGSRNQPPHLDLTKSLDVQGPLFAKDVADVADRLFW